MTDAALAAALRSRIEDELIAPRDLDFAASLLSGFARYQSFTERQRPHVARLAAGVAAATTVTGRPVYATLAALFAPGRLARLTVGDLSIVRKHDATVAWVKWQGRVVGVMALPAGMVSSTRGMRDSDREPVRAELERVAADPLAAVAKHGQATGRCSCCGRELTNADSIERSVGPICWGRLTGGAR
jgi:hypothetical protein